MCVGVCVCTRSVGGGELIIKSSVEIKKVFKFFLPAHIFPHILTVTKKYTNTYTHTNTQTQTMLHKYKFVNRVCHAYIYFVCTLC